MTGASAFLRFSRDRRGYEHFYLIESTTNRRGKMRARVLYWFRTPPGVKVGRPPFDDGMRRAIEERNPGVSFDWKRILATPIPPLAPDVERWRDRRSAERAERAARKTEQATETAADGDEPDSPEPPALDADALSLLEPTAVEADDKAGAESPLVGLAEAAPSGDASPSGDVAARRPPHKRRRSRRRGGRGRRPGAARAGMSAPVSEDSVASPPREAGPQHLDESQGE